MFCAGEKRESYRPHQVGDDGKPVARGEPEDQHGNGGAARPQRQRHLATKPVRHGARRHFSQHGRSPEDRFEDGDLGEREAAHIFQVEHPDAPPELEVHKKVQEVNFPDVGQVRLVLRLSRTCAMLLVGAFGHEVRSGTRCRVCSVRGCKASQVPSDALWCLIERDGQVAEEVGEIITQRLARSVEEKDAWC